MELQVGRDFLYIRSLIIIVERKIIREGQHENYQNQRHTEKYPIIEYVGGQLIENNKNRCKMQYSRQVEKQSLY